MRCWLPLALSAVLLPPATLGYERPCSFKRLVIAPITPGHSEIYPGDARTLRIRFHNYTQSDTVTAFPEPPLEIIQLRTQKQCSITEGGIWVRDSIFLSSDERLLMSLEYSGESNHLLIYDTASCGRVGDIDVSGAAWLLKGDRLTIGSGCRSRDLATCSSKRVVTLGKFCAADLGEKRER